MTPSQEEFVPQKIVVGRRGRRRGHAAPSTTSSSDQSTKQDTITTTNNNITTVPLNDTQQKQQQQKRSTRSTATSSAPQISSSVVFHEEDTEQLINELANDNNIEPPSSTTQLSSSQQKHNTDTTNTDISSSVVFHEEQIELFDEIDELYPHEHEGGKIVADPHSSTASPPGVSSSILSTTGKGGLTNSTLSGSLTTSRSLASSVIRSLHESSSLSGSKSYNGVLPTDYASLVASSNDGTLAEMVAEMTMACDNSNKQNANWEDQQEEGLIRRNKSNPNLQQSLLSTLTEGSHEQSTKMSSISGGDSNNKNRRSSIVGGKPISQMTYEEQRVLMAPDRSDRSLLVNFDNTNTNNEDDELEITGMIDISERDDGTIVSNFPDNTIDNDNVIVSSTDWSSLSKSCKRAKNDFKDMDSGLTVVRNMFMTHLRPLTAVLTLYSKRCCCSSGNDIEEGKEISLNELKSRTTETKRALRFAMSCLAPPRPSEDNNNESGGTPSANDVQDGVDIYRVDRRYRQELQDAAVKGFTYTQRSHSLPSLTASTRSANSYNSYNEGGEEMTRHHYGLQIPLVEIINDTNNTTQSQQCHILEEEINDPALFASIERDKRTVRILAARMLCNLVTDNPLAAELVLKDIPFSPNPDLKERRLATSIFGSREQAQRVDGHHQGPKRSNSKSDDEIIFWSDLISVTAKVQPATAAVVNNGKGKRHGDNQSSGEDREELAAVSAALHNLLTSLEARESLLELDDEMKRRRREIAKQQQNIHLSSPQRKVSTTKDGEEDEEEKPITPMDAGFEIASDGTLLNALLRNILPTKAVLMQAKRDKERSEPSRPQFKSSSTTVDDNLSDSATEWISLILERLASRGLLPKMLQSAGGTYMKSKTVTPEQVVLVSCIRQAVDDYHSSLTSTGETGGFGRRRLSIAAKSVGITISSRPHPLWGRADPQAVAARDSRTAVPVLLSLANEAEELRIRENELKKDPSVATYDGELNCTTRIIVDLVDILAQSLGRHAGSYLNGFQNQRNKPQCFIADARSVLGRETTIIKSCCEDLGKILDMTLAKNQGKKAREMELSEQDQHAAIVNVRLIGNIIFQCRHNQDLIRITPVPMLVDDDKKSAATAATNEVPTERTGLHVILSATSLAPVCFTLREWCIVAIRNAMDGNAANAETCRRLEANQVMDDTPELQKLGVKMSLDKNGKVQISRRDNDDT